MRQTRLWRLLRRSERLKRLRRRLLLLSKRARRRLTRGSDALVAGSAIYLTFDDGPDPTYSPQILDLLADHDAKAVFYAIGSLADAGSDILRRALAEGHRLGNHTWDHVPLADLPRTAFDAQVVRTQQELERTTGNRPRTMRPPFGAMDSNARPWAAAAGVDVVLWDLDTQDWVNPGVDSIVSSIVDYARPGDVVLMHDGGGDRRQTVVALRLVLEQLSHRGVVFPLLPGS